MEKSKIFRYVPEGHAQEHALEIISYLQKIRINAAKALLERPHSIFEEVTYHVGYEDISSFRKIFQRHTGLRPKEYQRLFQQRNQIPQAG